MNTRAGRPSGSGVLGSRSMDRSGRSFAAALALLLAPAAVRAQPEVLFGSGKAPVYAEQDVDRRFEKSRLAHALARGVEDPNCAQVAAGLLTLLAETAPYLHERDENFFLDPALVNALSTQLVNARFPGNAYLASMVRRVMIDGKVPAAWVKTARALNEKGATIDIAKLQFLADGVRPIESFYFTFEALRQRYDIEVRRATTAARPSAVLRFRDAYLDREVAWTGLTLVDIRAPGKKNRKKEGAGPLVAILQWVEPDPYGERLNIFGKPEGRETVRIEAELAPTQFVDIHRIPKGTRVLVRGRFWKMNDGLTELELRNAVLFGERDWSGGVVLAQPQAVAQCPFAVNDLAGTAPVQPGGFGQRLGQ